MASGNIKDYFYCCLVRTSKTTEQMRKNNLLTGWHLRQALISGHCYTHVLRTERSDSLTEMFNTTNLMPKALALVKNNYSIGFYFTSPFFVISLIFFPCQFCPFVIWSTSGHFSSVSNYAYKWISLLAGANKLFFFFWVVWSLNTPFLFTCGMGEMLKAVLYCSLVVWPYSHPLRACLY